MAGSIIPSIIGTAGSLLGGVGSIIGQNAQNKANLRLADYQFGKNVEMWKMQNAYNAPSAQMDRLKAAGLNPNLIYGEGVNGSTGNATGTAPSYSPPDIKKDYSSVGNSLSTLAQYQNFELQRAQIDNVKAQTDVANQNAKNAAIAGSGMLTDNLQKAFNYGQSTKMGQSQIDYLLAQIRNLNVSSDTALSHGDLFKAQTVSEGFRQALSKAQTDVEREKLLNMAVQRLLMNSEVSRNRASTGNLIQDTALKSVMTGIDNYRLKKLLPNEQNNLYYDWKNKQLDYDYYSNQGVRSNDPWWRRATSFWTKGRQGWYDRATNTYTFKSK